MELNEEDLDALAHLIKGGSTSGIIDTEDDDGANVRISWTLSTEKFIH